MSETSLTPQEQINEKLIDGLAVVNESLTILRTWASEVNATMREHEARINGLAKDIFVILGRLERIENPISDAELNAIVADENYDARRGDNK